MALSRRDFTLGSLLAAGTLGLPVFVKAQQGKTVALLFDSLVSPFWVSGLDIMREKAKANGWQVLENISNFDDNKQFEQVKAMIGRKVDGILIIQTDSKAVILIGDLGDVNAIQRRDGFFDVVGKNPDLVEVVARVSTEWNADKAFAGLTNAFQANPDIDFLFTSSDFMLPQIQQVMETFDKWYKRDEEGHVLLGGFDGDANAYQLIQDGYMDACGVQNLFLEVDMAFQAFQDMWAGKKPEKLLLDPGFVITAANMEETRDKMWGYIVWQKSKA